MSIDASELIEYSVSVVDNCGDTGNATFTDLANLKGLQWPSLFFPIRGELTNEENRTFGPKNDCPTLVPVSYELHIYNRWGQEVFSSNAIENEWDGKLSSGDNAPVDTYIYQATYDYGEGKINAQGDVTIIR
jgi:gliding motility-associated-like protein